MNDLIQRLYQSYLSDNGFHYIKDTSQPGYSYELDKGLGQGNYWIYPVNDSFAITAYDLSYTTNFSTQAKLPIATGLGTSYASNAKEWFGCHHNKRQQLVSFTGDGRDININIVPGDHIRNVGIAFTPEYYNKRLAPVIQQEYKEFSSHIHFVNGQPNLPEIHRLMNQFISYSYDNPYIGILLEGNLISLLGQILSDREAYEHPKTSVSSDEQQLHLVRSYLDHHFNNDIKLDTLLKLACMSKSKLLDRFKKNYGMTITDYIRLQRMDTAKKLLITTNSSLKNIANEIGYKRQSSFSEIFRQLEGLTPSQFRSIYTNKNHQ